MMMMMMMMMMMGCRVVPFSYQSYHSPKRRTAPRAFDDRNCITLQPQGLTQPPYSITARQAVAPRSQQGGAWRPGSPPSRSPAGPIHCVALAIGEHVQPSAPAREQIGLVDELDDLRHPGGGDCVIRGGRCLWTARRRAADT